MDEIVSCCVNHILACYAFAQEVCGSAPAVLRCYVLLLICTTAQRAYDALIQQATVGYIASVLSRQEAVLAGLLTAVVRVSPGATAPAAAAAACPAQKTRTAMES